MKNPNRKAAERRAAAMGGAGGNDTLIIVDTKNGSSKKYAEWLSDMLDTDLVAFSRKYLAYSSMYRNVIYIGWVNKGDISHLNMLQQNYSNFNLAGKKIIVIAVGLGADSKSYWKRLYDYNHLKGFANYFYCLPGSLNPNSIKAGSLTALKSFTPELLKLYGEKDAKLIMERIRDGYDGVSRDKLIPIAEELRRDIPDIAGKNARM